MCSLAMSCDITMLFRAALWLSFCCIAARPSGTSVKDYDPFFCSLQINRHKPPGLVMYDLSREAGINNLISGLKYVLPNLEEDNYDQNESPPWFLSNDTVINLQAYLCSYMRPFDEVLKCGDQNLVAPSSCIILSKPNEVQEYYSATKIKRFIEVEGNLIIEMEVDSTRRNAETFIIKFLLTHNPQEKTAEISYITSDKITVKWSSQFFLPAQEIVVENNCQINYMDQIFDARPLISEYGFRVKSPIGTYLLNFCSKLKVPNPYLRVESKCNENSAICLIGNSTLSQLNSSQLIYSSHKGILMRFIHEFNQFGFNQINFECSSGKTVPHIELFSTKPVLIFKIYSALPCPKKSAICEIEPRDVQYSFSSESALLHNLKFDVENGSSYFISLCRTLIPTSGETFTGGDIFAAFDDKKNGVIVNLGVQQIQPYLDNNNNIVVGFNGSDKCEGDKYHSLTVILICNGNEGSTYEILPTNSKCIHKIKWKTKHACPYSFKEFNNCKLRDSAQIGYDAVFDLNPLRNENDYEVDTEHGTVVLNVCGTLIQSFNQSAAVLHKRNDNEVVIIGRSPANTYLRNGIIMLEYKGDSCDGITPYSILIIRLFCSSNPTLKPEFIHKTVDCIFRFHWYTPQACIPNSSLFPHICEVASPSKMFDLASLPGTIFETSNKNSTVYFGFCSSTPVILCGPDSTACWIFEQPDNSIDRISFQKGLNTLQVENGNLMLSYKSDVECTKNVKYSFNVLFECEDNEVMTDLEIVEGSDNCKIQLKMKLKQACKTSPVPFSSNKPVFEIETTTNVLSCETAYDPRINLHHLKNKIWRSVEYKMNVSVCSPFPESDSGACREVDTGFDCQKYSDELLYRPRLPYLNYTCSGCAATLITFPCDHSDVLRTTLKVIDDYTNIITWPTAASCFSQTDDYPDICRDDKFNSFLKVYNMSISSQSYLLIGICSQLPDECLVGTGACLVEHSSYGDRFTSLGYPVKELKTDYFNNKIMKFIDGAMCSRTGQQYSVAVKFICQRDAEKDSLVHLYKRKDCEYIIELRSLLLCSEEVIQKHKSEKSSHNNENRTELIENEDQLKYLKEKENTNLNKLYLSLPPCSSSSPIRCIIDNLAHIEPLYILDDIKKKKYSIDFIFNKKTPRQCGVSMCNFKNHWKPLANFHNISYITNNKTFKMEYTSLKQDSSCRGFSGVEMFLKCMVDSTHGGSTLYNLSPVLRWENMCSVGIEWYTDYACIPAVKQSSSSAPPSKGYDWWMIALILFLSVIVLVPCTAVIILRKKCFRLIFRCCGGQRHRSNSIHFSRVNSRISLSTLSDGTESTVLFQKTNLSYESAF